MNPNLKVTGIIALGLLISVVSPRLILMATSKSLETKQEATPISNTSNQTQNTDTAIVLNEKKDTAVPVVETPQEETPQEPVEEKTEEKVEEVKNVQETVSEPVVETPVATKSYSEMTVEELINAIANGTYKLEYSGAYDTGANKLTKSKGAIYYNDHKETYYSQRVLSGSSLNIPGRHVADDGTVRDGDGYICVAANSSYLSKGSIVKTSVGPAKVYDSGCASGTIDIYTNW